MSNREKRIYHGTVKDRQIVLQDDLDLPDGSQVEIRPARARRGTVQAVLDAVDSSPHVTETDVAQLCEQIESGRRPVRFGSPLDD